MTAPGLCFLHFSKPAKIQTLSAHKNTQVKRQDGKSENQNRRQIDVDDTINLFTLSPWPISKVTHRTN